MMKNHLVFVIFGATGDLMHRKLIRAIYQLVDTKQLDIPVQIIGVGRRNITTEDFILGLTGALELSYPTIRKQKNWISLQKHIMYVQGFFEDNIVYSKLVDILRAIDTQKHACASRFFYLATPPEHYEHIIRNLALSKLSSGCGQSTGTYTRIIIEKPFGKDLATAKSLDRLLAKTFDERQIYRIDHYLGKETVQNILAFRFANGIFEPTWNSEFIDHVQITFAETDGVGKRGEFYEGVGALRDVVQNHVLEMLALVAMEQPQSFDAQSVRDQKVAVLNAIAPFSESDVATFTVRGQYSSSSQSRAYIEESGVSKKSDTETYVALKLKVRTPRWRTVPFYIRAGKRMPQKVTQISLHYKKPALCFDDICLFNQDEVYRNVLSLQIHPEEGVTLRLMVKRPGYGMKLEPTIMHYSQGYSIDSRENLDAYSKLLLDAIAGDQVLFARTDGIEASWKVITSILEGWKKQQPKMSRYEGGSWGPNEGFNIIEQDGRKWFI